MILFDKISHSFSPHADRVHSSILERLSHVVSVRRWLCFNLDRIFFGLCHLQFFVEKYPDAAALVRLQDRVIESVTRGACRFPVEISSWGVGLVSPRRVPLKRLGCDVLVGHVLIGCRNS
jgi:hypothetical protein